MCHYIIVIIKLSSMSLNFGDISGVELREKPQEESDLEDEVFFKNGEEDLDKTNDNILLHAVIWRGLPGYFTLALFAGVYQDLAPTAFSGKK